MDRRAFVSSVAAVGLAPSAERAPGPAFQPQTMSLNGVWQFRLGTETKWRDVTVPHTWQVAEGCTDYYGEAWYRREILIPREWASGVVRLEFEAVFHSAWVTLNGKPVGEHTGKGYTSFVLDLTPLAKWGEKNLIEVRVDNGFQDAMLPRGRSSDWAHDGGIYRPVHLHVTPKTFLERLDVDATPEAIRVNAIVRGGGAALDLAVIDDATGAVVARSNHTVAAGENPLPPFSIAAPKLWHFDHPNLYRLEARLANGHGLTAMFGIRTFTVGKDGFYLNGERVFLMGVERMAGSHPDFGMAEPSSWIEHDHDDMKRLNCVFTRVHWPQDQRVLEYCDRHGILIQTEVPAWGPKTFEGMNGEPSPGILNNGLEQLREMIARDRNHPSIVSWGLCNEIGGQNPPAYQFAKRMYEEAKRLDPRRPCSYASHSLFTTPEKDVSGLMDFVEWNEYYGSWQKGDAATLQGTLEQLHRAFPDKLIVISEYGYCACTADRPEADATRIQVLEAHDKVFRDAPYVAGLIFFCYNDYRTHMGDRGEGVLKQRVHGVVDVYGDHKESYAVLRAEASPIEKLTVRGDRITIRNRASVPCYTLTGYTLRHILFGQGGIPVETGAVEIPTLAPGAETTLIVGAASNAKYKVRLEVLRPTGFSAFTHWVEPA